MDCQGTIDSTIKLQLTSFFWIFVVLSGPTNFWLDSAIILLIMARFPLYHTHVAIKSWATFTNSASVKWVFAKGTRSSLALARVLLFLVFYCSSSPWLWLHPASLLSNKYVTWLQMLLPFFLSLCESFFFSSCNWLSILEIQFVFWLWKWTLVSYDIVAFISPHVIWLHDPILISASNLYPLRISAPYCCKRLEKANFPFILLAFFLPI